LLSGLALLALIAGVGMAASGGGLGVILGFGSVALGLVVSAEVIRLFLAMEEHLYEMRSYFSGLATSTQESMQPARPPQTTAIYTPTRVTASGSAPKSVALRGTVKPERTLIVGTPGVRMARAIAAQNQVLKLIGRTQDQRWVQVELKSEAWVETSDLSIEGDVSTLPVRYNSQG
jgi:hypothetical protein